MMGPMRAIFESFACVRYFFGYTRATDCRPSPDRSTFEGKVERDRSARPTVMDMCRGHRTVRSPNTHAAATAACRRTACAAEYRHIRALSISNFYLHHQTGFEIRLFCDLTRNLMLSF